MTQFSLRVDNMILLKTVVLISFWYFWNLIQVGLIKMLILIYYTRSYFKRAWPLPILFQGFNHCGMKLLAILSRLLHHMLYIRKHALSSLQLLIDIIWVKFQLANSPNHHLRAMALKALDQSISAVLGSDQFEENALSRNHGVCEDVTYIHCLC